MVVSGKALQIGNFVTCTHCSNSRTSWKHLMTKWAKKMEVQVKVHENLLQELERLQSHGKLGLGTALVLE